MNEQNPSNKKRLRGLGAVVTAVFIAGMVSLALLNLPRGFDMDLEKIGTGKPAVVFVYDNNLSVSGAQTEEMNRIRDEYGEQLHFLVADVGRPQARDWMQRHQARSADLFFFDAQGGLQHRQTALLDAPALRETIRLALGVQQ